MSTRRNLVTAFLALACTMGIFAQSERVDAYFTTQDMPDLLRILPGPPAENSVAFANDVARYYWGKQMRNDSLRAAIARRDAVYGIQTIINEFSEPFGLNISQSETPEIYILLRDALATCDSICTLPKAIVGRKRPFMVFNEETLVPADEPFLRKNGSWPSGHTILGWSAALLLSEINPERADTLMSRGLMYGESRVIVGAHWQSDVDAGRLAASMAYAKLHTNERFLMQMARARREFATKRAISR